jgi:hypothetical protein
LTVTEIAQAANLPLSTTHRLVHELVAWGVLHRCDNARFEIVQWPHPGGCGDCGPDLRALAAPTVEDLSAVTRNDVRLGLLDGLRVSYVEKTHRGQPALGVLGRRDASGARDGARRPRAAQRAEPIPASRSATAAARFTENLAALARPADRPPVDLSATTTRPPTHVANGSGAGVADGPREPDLGLPTRVARIELGASAVWSEQLAPSAYSFAASRASSTVSHYSSRSA